jgi:arginase
VLGGNCTIALRVMAALWRLDAGTPGLLYVDRHYDLNTPESTTDGALDWMGLAGPSAHVYRSTCRVPLII